MQMNKLELLFDFFGMTWASKFLFFASMLST